MPAESPEQAPDGVGAALRPVDVPARPRGFARIVAAVRAAALWWSRTRVGRASSRFGSAGGGVLTGGIAYATLFSVAAGLTLGFSVFMAVLGAHHALREAVVAALASALPGLVDTGDGHGGIDPTSLRLSAGVSVTGAVALVTLVLSALTAVGALQTGLRAMFALRAKDAVVLGRVRQLAGFAGLALALLVAAVLGLAFTSAADWAMRLTGWSDSSGLVLRGIGVLVSFVVDASVFVLLVRVLTQARPSRRDLLRGAAIAGVGLGLVRVLGTSVVTGSISADPVLAPFAAVVVLLLWVNLVARIVLLAAAWTADPPAAADRPEPDEPARARAGAGR
jgi:membrane protein